MRIGDYVVRQDTHGWVLATIKVRKDGKRKGEEFEANAIFPGRLDLALRALLERMVRDGLEPDASLEETVATVAHFYARIGEAVR